jgi:hypothetical protein
LNEFEIDGKNPFNISVYPNPFSNEFFVKFISEKTVTASYFLTNGLGQLLIKSDTTSFNKGENTISINVKSENIGESLFFTIIFDDKYYVTRKLIRK